MTTFFNDRVVCLEKCVVNIKTENFKNRSQLNLRSPLPGIFCFVPEKDGFKAKNLMFLDRVSKLSSPFGEDSVATAVKS